MTVVHVHQGEESKEFLDIFEDDSTDIDEVDSGVRVRPFLLHFSLFFGCHCR